MTDDSELGGRLRQRRVNDLHLSLADVAEKADLSIQYVSNLERGRGNPTIGALRSLASALDMSIDSLMGADVDPGDINLVLRNAPKSLRAFVSSDRFDAQLTALSNTSNMPYTELRERMIRSMVEAPRRSSGEPTETDWRRLFDTFKVIVTDDGE
ncbi:MAG TPA: helix-turn-helix transcriptional regulator [Mycobacterium sp.]|nr:helix-turn-helix transcriptional regulator [Mycobacterium sp.]